MSDRRKVWRTLIAKADAEASRAAAEVVLAENLLAELRASGAKLAIMRSDYAQRLVAGHREQAQTGSQINQIRGYIEHADALELKLGSSVEVARRGVERARKAYLDAVASRKKFDKLLEREDGTAARETLRLERIDVDAVAVARYNRADNPQRSPRRKHSEAYKT